MKVKNILVVANPTVPVPPEKYGGAERMIHLVNLELQKQGFNISLIGAKGSKSYGGKVFAYSKAGRRLTSRILQRLRFYFLAFRAARNAEIVINHGRVDYLQPFLFAKKPVINVFHNPIAQFEIDLVNRNPQKIRSVVLSRNHTVNLKGTDDVTIIPNGIDTSLLYFTPESKRTYFVFIGRMNRPKGVVKAILLCKAMGLTLKIAAPIPPLDSEDHSFYLKAVLPLIDDEQIIYVGNISDMEKVEFFSGAIANIFPLIGPEAFGLTVIESLACGVPVIGSKACALPEIIEEGKTGFLCNSDEEYTSAFKNIASIERRYCREQAVNRFSKEIMVKRYAELVHKTLAEAA